MILEYQIEIDKIKEENKKVECPPSNYSSKKYNAFRFVFEDIKNKNNFKPVYYLNPSRIENADPALKCKSLAISLFDSLENAKAKFQKLTARRPAKMYKTIGTHLAFSELKEADGICDNSNNDGHISHYFVKGFDYQKRFAIIKKLANK